MTDSRAPRSECRGLTLLEVMLALAISTVMIIALYSILYQATWAMETGDDVVREGQLARALLERMAVDIRASASGNGVYNAGLRGDVTNLRLYTHVVPAGLKFAQSDWRRPPAGASDLIEVTYSVPEVNEETGAGGGLIRRVRRVFGAIRADQGAVTSQNLADEVKGIQFRYSAGGEWRESWNGSGDVGCPKAVEITLTLRGARPAEEEENGVVMSEEIYGTEQATEMYRLVVAVPTGAEPQGTVIQRGRNSGGLF
jgi:type II secretion system protein J